MVGGSNKDLSTNWCGCKRAAEVLVGHNNIKSLKRASAVFLNCMQTPMGAASSK